MLLWRCCYLVFLVTNSSSYQISFDLFLPITLFSEYQSESTFYRDSTTLQSLWICNSLQTKSDGNGVSSEEIRQKKKTVLCGEQARTQFLPPVTNKIRLLKKKEEKEEKISPPHASLTQAHTLSNTHMRAGSCLKMR